jgi:FAD/FMN-containing dehydrogenase
MLEVTVKNGIVEKLGKITGNEYVSTNQGDLYVYSKDMTQARPNFPDMVVLPKSLEEVQAIIRLANEERIPVTPFVAGGNIGGLTIPT